MPFQTDAHIVFNEPRGPALFHIRLSDGRIARSSRPGHFVQLRCSDSQEPLMRRPFSVLAADAESGTFDIVYLVRGDFTRGLARLREGDTVSVVGPLGRGLFCEPPQGRKPLLVAGGVGAPPLAFLATHLRRGNPDMPITVINGARTATQLVAMEEFENAHAHIHVTTDDGSAGARGTVITVLSELVSDCEDYTVYACGPEPMLKAVGDFCIQRGLPCQLSLETVMHCGVGVCMGCAVKVRSDQTNEGYIYVRACYEGPVFRAEDILWD